MIAATNATWASKLPDFIGDRFPDAIAKGLNRTAIEAQHAMRLRLYQAFTIRGANTAQWFERMIKIPPRERATRYQLSATVRMEGTETGGPAAARRARNLLWRHETGGVHSPVNTFFGAFTMPGPNMRTVATNPPRSLYPTSLGLQPRRTIEGGFTTVGRKGKRRTYVVPGVGIFQRIGKDATLLGRREHGSVPLWWFYRKPIHLSARLRFHETIERTTRERLVPSIQFMIGEQLRIGAARLSRGQARGALTWSGAAP